MRLTHVRVQNFRCILDSGWFAIEDAKTVFVGANESGKTALLEALVRLNPPAGVRGYDATVDLPRRLSADGAAIDELPVATARFGCSVDEVPAAFADASYVVQRTMGNRARHWLEGGPQPALYDATVERDLARLAAAADRRVGRDVHVPRLAELTRTWAVDRTVIDGDRAAAFDAWIESVRHALDAEDRVEQDRLERVVAVTDVARQRREVLAARAADMPMFVYFDGRFGAGRAIDIAEFADRYDQGFAAPTQQDVADLSVFRLLGMSPRELADADGAGAERRDRRLASVSRRLTTELHRVWQPTGDRLEAQSLEVAIDAGYLRLYVTDADGVRVPFEQRSSGFRWLVSFLVEFLAESGTTLRNAILMLDEPGMRLHPDKQARFRATLDRLAAVHQTMFTTHSPYLVGPEDLTAVRTVEHVGASEGTLVHTAGGAVDPAASMPLVESVAATISEELFGAGRGLLCARLSDYWYVSVVAELVRTEGEYLDDVEFVLAGPVAHLVAMSAVLRNRGLAVAALLDTDAAGVGPEVIARRAGGAAIVRPAAVFERATPATTIEDLLRHTLAAVVRDRFGLALDAASVEADTPILAVIATAAGAAFDRTRLAQAFVDWAGTHTVADLDERDRARWMALADEIRFAISA